MKNRRTNNQAVIGMLIEQECGHENRMSIWRVFLDIFDDVETALAVSQIVYWSDKGKGGWFYKTYQDWQEELKIKEWKMRKILQSLESEEIIQTDVRKVGDTPKTHIKLNMRNLADKITEWAEANGKLKEEYEEDEDESGLRDIAESEPLKTAGSDPLKTAGTLKTSTTMTSTTTLTRENFENEKPEETEENKDDPEEYFRMLEEKQGKKREQFSLKEYKERIAQAVISNAARNSEKNKEIEIYLEKVPVYIRDLASAFCYSKGRAPTKKENAYWISGWKQQYEIGLEPEHIRSAIKEMNEYRLTVKSPESVTAIAERFKQNGSANQYQKFSEIYIGGKVLTGEM